MSVAAEAGGFPTGYCRFFRNMLYSRLNGFSGPALALLFFLRFSSERLDMLWWMWIFCAWCGEGNGDGLA